VLPGEQTILSVINLSGAALDTRLELSRNLLGESGGVTFTDLLDASRFTAPVPGSFTLTMSPFQPRILLVQPDRGAE
jgi:hypothetical protein